MGNKTNRTHPVEEEHKGETCLKGHQLLHSTATQIWICDGCKIAYNIGEIAWRCKEDKRWGQGGKCNYDVCFWCIGNGLGKEGSVSQVASVCRQFGCLANHGLQEFTSDGNETKGGQERWRCDFPPQGSCLAGLGKNYLLNPGVSVWRCTRDSRVNEGGVCNFDLCDKCKTALENE